MPMDTSPEPEYSFRSLASLIMGDEELTRYSDLPHAI